MTPADETGADEAWLLLIHQIPPKPDHLRVKIGRRLQRIGAVAVKNSVYGSPDRAESLEDFQWVRVEVIEGGGGASMSAGICHGYESGWLRRARSTRSGIFVDRMASAWLIRSFIDRDARFRFVDAKATPAAGASLRPVQRATLLYAPIA